MFSQLLEREAFCDVTLACEGRTIKAHKIVLSACSTYFDTILSQYEEKDPILIMKDVKYVDIKCLVEFMYKGEINVDHVSTSTPTGCSAINCIKFPSSRIVYNVFTEARTFNRM